MSLVTADLEFDLPRDLVAMQPAEPRDAARLLVCRRHAGGGLPPVEHLTVADLASLPEWSAGDLLVRNETSVLPASFDLVRRETGGRLQALFLSAGGGAAVGDSDWRLLLRSGGKPRVGETLTGEDGLLLQLLDREADPAGGPPVWRAEMRFEPGACHVRPEAYLERHGRMPLPHYIQAARKRAGQPKIQADDRARYNTLFAREPGSVAAPTAGLHLTPGVMERLAGRGVTHAAVTLHVGMGTFAPVTADTLADHRLHHERWLVRQATLQRLLETRAKGGCVCAVGTTSVRTLESLPDRLDPSTGVGGQTDLFIRPDAGFQFRWTDRLMTNFHLPRSTLLALVASLPGVGVPRLLEWYALAVRRRYRFYSFGDAMLVV